MTATATTYYAVVTFGLPETHIPSVFRSLDKATDAAHFAKGTGTCTDARVYACDTAALAQSADISKVRQGERTVTNA